MDECRPLSTGLNAAGGGGGGALLARDMADLYASMYGEARPAHPVVLMNGTNHAIDAPHARTK